MTKFISLNHDLELAKENLIATLKTLNGQTLTHQNGTKHTIANVLDNGDIETANGKTFSLVGLKSFKLPDGLQNKYDNYFSNKERIESIGNNMRSYQKELVVGANSELREKFYDMLISKLPYNNVIGANKRPIDPQYLKLNLSDDFYLDNGLDKNAFEVGINVSYSLLATFVIVNGTEARDLFIERAKTIVEATGVNYVVEPASLSDNENGRVGVRIHNYSKLFIDNYDAAIEFIKELIRDTLHLIKFTGVFYK